MDLSDPPHILGVVSRVLPHMDNILSRLSDSILRVRMTLFGQKVIRDGKTET